MLLTTSVCIGCLCHQFWYGGISTITMQTPNYCLLDNVQSSCTLLFWSTCGYKHICSIHTWNLEPEISCFQHSSILPHTSKFLLDKNFTKPSYLCIAERFGGINFHQCNKVAVFAQVMILPFMRARRHMNVCDSSCVFLCLLPHPSLFAT